MSDEREKLRTTIDDLHAELAGMDQLDDEMQQLLHGAVSDIRGALDKKPKDDIEQSSLIGRLSQAARHYEDSHPTLSGIIGSVIDALSRMGV